jgi:hypothetical protein
LPDFNLTIDVVFANRLEDANNPFIVAQLEGSDVIFMGPGSPIYAVNHLRGTLLLTKIIELVKNRTTLILASAATISCSRYALPVYEIFKVGEDLHWEDGLNLYGDIWQEATIIPHFNNREGGADLDTSYCYIGKERATKMLSMLPTNSNIISLDEHTALIIDLQTKEQSIRGKGSVRQF